MEVLTAQSLKMHYLMMQCHWRQELDLQFTWRRSQFHRAIEPVRCSFCNFNLYLEGELRRGSAVSDDEVRLINDLMIPIVLARWPMTIDKSSQHVAGML